MSNLTKKRKEKQNNYHTQSQKKKKKKATCPPTTQEIKKNKKNKKRTRHGHFCSLNSLIFSIQFSLHFWEKIFWWVQGENTRPHYLFSFLPTQPNTLKKFSSPFSLQSFPSILFHLQTNTPLRL